jgi:hypothetical protein
MIPVLNDVAIATNKLTNVFFVRYFIKRTELLARRIRKNVQVVYWTANKSVNKDLNFV